jgi:hypothetical protein
MLLGLAVSARVVAREHRNVRGAAVFGVVASAVGLGVVICGILSAVRD